jgi:hypothetical protein
MAVNKDSKMKFLKHLAGRKEMFVPLDSMPNFGDNKTIAESLLREGLLGIERREDGSILNVVKTKPGCRVARKK